MIVCNFKLSASDQGYYDGINGYLCNPGQFKSQVDRKEYIKWYSAGQVNFNYINNSEVNNGN